VSNDVLENNVNEGDIYNEIINILEAESDELVDLGNGKYKHIAADGTEVEFDVNSVNVEKVVDADGNISYVFKDADGNPITEIEITNDVLENIINEGDIYNEIINLIDSNETVTRIEEEDGIYTYYNEEDTPFVIDIPSSVVENFENIYNQIVNEEITVDGDTYNSFEEYLTTVINNATSFEDNDFIKV